MVRKPVLYSIEPSSRRKPKSNLACDSGLLTRSHSAGVMLSSSFSRSRAFVSSMTTFVKKLRLCVGTLVAGGSLCVFFFVFFVERNAIAARSEERRVGKEGRSG